MLKLSIGLLRRRLGTSVATLVALAAGVMILMTLSVFIVSAAVYKPDPGRYAAMDVVVAHRQVEIVTKEFDGENSVTHVALPEGTVPADLGDKLRALPGVTDVQVFPGPTRDRVAAFGVKGDALKAVERLAKENGVEAYAGDDRGFADRSEAGDARSFLMEAGAAFGGYVVLLIIFVVTGTVGLAVRHRRRDLALLRAIAATPRQVRALVMAENAVLALAASVIGVPAALSATTWVHDQLISRGFVPETLPIVGEPVAAAFAVVLILLVAIVAARIAARRVSRIKPAEALGDIAVEPPGGGKVRFVFGVLTLGAGGAATVFALGTTGMAAQASAIGLLYLYVIAVALLAPWINAFAARVFGPVLRAGWGVSGGLAVANLRANARGSAAVLTALVLAVGFGGSVWFLQNNLQRQTVTQSQDGMKADYALVGSLPAGAAEKIRRTPGVEAATGVRNTSVVAPIFDGGEPATAKAVDVSGLSSTMDLGVSQGSLEALNGNSVAVSQLRADSSGWKVGDDAKMWLPDGRQVTLKVVAIYDRGLGFADVLLPRDLVAGPDDQVLIRGKAVQYPGASLVPASELTGQLSRDLALSAWLNKLLIGVMVGYAALAAGNTMVMAALARKRELAVLQLAGVTRRQVRRMVTAEQVGLLGGALTIGALIAAVTLTAVVNALTGSPIPYVSAMGWAVVLGGATVLALVTTILPVWRLLRVPAVHNAGIKE
ncbi:FtsX-like permease family protein [Actinoplanes sp. NPDC048796]|uniref:FtsX-like permease family protein n=1 Tax=Actinoplanes sp. NPDC048796 TaxID=3155640 RepID=UPI0033CCBC60